MRHNKCISVSTLVKALCPVIDGVLAAATHGLDGVQMTINFMRTIKNSFEGHNHSLDYRQNCTSKVRVFAMSSQVHP